MKEMIFKDEIKLHILMLSLGIFGMLANILIWPNIVRIIVFTIITIFSSKMLYNTVKEHKESWNMLSSFSQYFHPLL